jgi:hypothetical protein
VTLAPRARQSVSRTVTTEGGLSALGGCLEYRHRPHQPTRDLHRRQGDYQVDEQVSITCTAADALSGHRVDDSANVNGPAYSFGLGSHTFSATATDRAGNGVSGSVTFTVGVTVY